MPQNTIVKYLNNRLTDSYGTRRGFVSTYGHRIKYLMGGYRTYTQIDWDDVERLVFVCKGNICRSAFAEAVANSLEIESISCGIDTRDGLPADDGAIRAAAKVDIDLREHKTRTLGSLSFSKNDLIIAMEPVQAKTLEGELENVAGYTLLGLWGNPIYPMIQDPYGASPAYYEKCLDYIEKSVHEIAKRIR